MATENIEAKEHECDFCQHKVIKYIHNCKRCTRRWESYLDHPVICPRCKSPYWDTERKSLRWSGLAEMEIGAVLEFPWPPNSIGVTHPVIAAVKRIQKHTGMRFDAQPDHKGITVKRIA